MDEPDPSQTLSIGMLGHHPGMHVAVNLQGKTLGGITYDDEQWLNGVIVGSGALGSSITVKLDAPIGGGSGGFLHRSPHGDDMVSIDDPTHVRPLEVAGPQAVPSEIVELVRAGKTAKALKRYRALNGATLEEAQAAIAKLSP